MSTSSVRGTPALRGPLIAALTVMAIHIALTWGYISLFWGDYGRTLYQIDRVAHGARMYADISWPFPPLGMWLVGGMTRVIGSDLTQIWSVTSGIALALAAAYAAIVARLVPARLAVPVTVTGVVLGTAFSQQLSAPLSMGMYTPSVPIAFLCLLLQLLVFLHDWERPTLARALLVGALGGAGFLAKHDVWFASAVLALAAGVFTQRGSETRLARVLAAGGGYGLVAGTGVALLAAEYGVGALRDIAGGFGHVDEFAGVNLPDLATLTVEVATSGVVLAAAALIGWVSGVWRGRSAIIALCVGITIAATAAGIWLLHAELLARALQASHATDATANPLGRELLPVASTPLARFLKAFAVLRFQMVRHLVPALAPLVVLALFTARSRSMFDTRRRTLVIVLLVTCVALRGRRMIAFTEWSNLMLEVPVYVAAVALLWDMSDRRLVRSVQLACVVLALFGLYFHQRSGYGLGTRRGRVPATATVRGAVHIALGTAKDLASVRRLLLEIDPSGRRALHAFGYSSGFNYYLARPAVGSMTQGFRLSTYPTPDSAYRVALVEKDGLILLDNPSYGDAVPVARFAPWRWQPEMQQNPYMRDDRPLFDRLREGCHVVGEPGGRSIFTVYDCAPRGSSRSPFSLGPKKDKP